MIKRLLGLGWICSLKTKNIFFKNGWFVALEEYKEDFRIVDVWRTTIFYKIK